METKSFDELTGDIDSLKLREDNRTGNYSAMGSLGIHHDGTVVYVKYRFDAPHPDVPFIHTHSPEILIGSGGKRPKLRKTELIEKKHINLEV